MNEVIVGSIVWVSALFPSNASTISGNPVASVNKPMVICGSSRRSVDNPGSRNPSAVSVSKYRVDTSWSTSQAGPQRRALRAGCRQTGSPRLLRITRQTTLERRIGHRVDPGLLEHPQGVLPAGGLDDPRQHQFPGTPRHRRPPRRTRAPHERAPYRRQLVP